MRLGLLSFNSIIGDLKGNLERVILWGKRAKEKNLDLLLLPELALQGYPPCDILLRPGFAFALKEQIRSLEEQWKKESLEKVTLIVGSVLPQAKNFELPLMNGAICLHEGNLALRAKSLIANYDVFHEERYFSSALKLDPLYRSPLEVKGNRIALLFCEDSWHGVEIYNRPSYFLNPTKELKKANCNLLVNLSASPFHVSKREERVNVIRAGAMENAIDIAYVNASGANDELIFDGHSFFMSKKGEMEETKDIFEESLFCLDYNQAEKIEIREETYTQRKEETKKKEEELYEAIRIGIRDYVKKNGFSKVVLGISGGIDSALLACLAVDALGRENVFALFLPTRYSSLSSEKDARELTRNLAISLEEISIEDIRVKIDSSLVDIFKNRELDSTEENIQARLRGLFLMAVSNKLGYLLLATGNKSEIAMGYSTLYGDMCGALIPLGDLYKTQLQSLARYVNQDSIRIPLSILDKEPSAELKPGQKDSDSLPSYELLDPVLMELIEEERSLDSCLLLARKLLLREEDIRSVFQKLHSSEFKRKQAAPILRVSKKAFGMGRLYPLTKKGMEYL